MNDEKQPAHRPDKIVVFDLETGGKDPERHAVIQIAAVAVDRRDDWAIVDSFEQKVCFRPENAQTEALEVNSYDDAVWKAEAQPPSLVADLFAAFLKEHATSRRIGKTSGKPYVTTLLCGHNAVKFDIPFILKWYKRLGKEGAFFACWWECLDTIRLAHWVFSERDDAPENYQLATLADYFGLDRTGAHDALVDVTLTAQIAHHLLRLMKGK